MTRIIEKVLSKLLGPSLVPSEQSHVMPYGFLVVVSLILTFLIIVLMPYLPKNKVGLASIICVLRVVCSTTTAECAGPTIDLNKEPPSEEVDLAPQGESSGKHQPNRGAGPSEPAVEADEQIKIDSLREEIAQKIEIIWKKGELKRERDRLLPGQDTDKSLIHQQIEKFLRKTPAKAADLQKMREDLFAHRGSAQTYAHFLEQLPGAEKKDPEQKP